jgi:hypothetical protein
VDLVDPFLEEGREPSLNQNTTEPPPLKARSHDEVMDEPMSPIVADEDGRDDFTGVLRHEAQAGVTLVKGRSEAEVILTRGSSSAVEQMSSRAFLKWRDISCQGSA